MRSGLILFGLAVLAAAQNLPNPYYELKTVFASPARDDGRQASDTLLDGAYGVAEDASGNVFLSEPNVGIIRKVRADGVVEHLATSEPLTRPTVLLVDKDGELLFYDAGLCRIRKVRADGVVADVAGAGRCGGSTPGSFGSSRERKALDTDISGVGGLTLDLQGRLIYSEPARNIVRRIDSDGFIRTIAGLGVAGYAGDDAEATSANLAGPQGVATDGSGNLYIGDGTNCRIRMVDSAGIITTVLGTTTCGSASSALSGGAKTILAPVGPIAYDASANALFIGMPKAYRVARYDLTAKRLAPFLGNARVGVDAPASPLTLSLNDPSAILSSIRYGVLVAADSSFQVYQVQNGAVRTFAGSWPKHVEAEDTATTQLIRPGGLLLMPGGSMLFTDLAAGFLLQWNGAEQVSPLAGTTYPSGYTTGEGGPALKASLISPFRAVQKSTGEIYISTPTNIRYINRQGVIRTFLNGLSNPTGLTLDSEERLLFAEAGRHQIKRYDFNTAKTTVIAGTGSAGMTGDGEQATSARLNSPGDIAFDSGGNLLIADVGNHRVRRLNTNGTIETVAGNGLPLAYCDINGMSALKTGLGSIGGLALDANDNIYLSEGVRVIKITNDGKIWIVTGFVSEDDDGNRSYLDGPLTGVTSVAAGSAGQLYFALSQHGKILMAVPRAQ
jgi:trimeric autotransporter adhesin